MANIRDVATRAGVSATTVSRILNGDKGFAVQEKTRNRVWEAINELGYRPANRKPQVKEAAPPAAGVYAIGSVLNITVEGIGDPSFLSILQGIEDALKQNGQALTFFRVANDIDLPDAIARIPNPLNGFIAMHSLLNEDYSRLANLVEHIVGIDAHIEGLDSVGYDHYQVGALAAEHLLAQGYRSFGFFYGDDEDPLQEQTLVSFRHAVTAAGGSLRPEHTVLIDNWKQSICYQKTVEMLSSPNRPRAIYYASDLMAVTAIGAVHSLRLSIPDDVAIMGISNNAMTAYTSPPLTTIDLPLTDMGKVAVGLLLSRIQGNPSPTQRIHLPVRLIPRASTLRTAEAGGPA